MTEIIDELKKSLNITDKEVNTTIKDTIITFKIPKQWLEENNIQPTDITLYHQTKEKWITIDLTIINQDEENIYYQAKINTFSLFMIGTKIQTQTTKWPTILIIIVLAIVIIAWLTYILTIKKNKKR